jgi:hypothetical protein
MFNIKSVTFCAGTQNVLAAGSSQHSTTSVMNREGVAGSTGAAGAAAAAASAPADTDTPNCTSSVNLVASPTIVWAGYVWAM